MKWMRIIGWWWLTGMALLAVQIHAQESLCAVVKIEIAQELTLERQAFEATMRITNSLDSMALENITIDILFEDSDGNAVVASSDPNHSTARFFINVDGDQGISSLVKGNNGAITDGVIDPAEVGELRWLIVPTVGAGGDDGAGRLYYVGATLNFTYGGESQTIEVAPDTIVVKPQPNLTLDYFLPGEVNGDNPFTAEQEPVEPYHLGLRIANTGSGPAHAVKIQSAQPEIIENKQGLLVDFLITGSFVNDAPAAKTLLIDFGDIPATANTTGRWIMETSTTGTFTEFDATFSHADEFGGELTSLVNAINTHTLVHDVLVDLPGRDNVRDFLSEDAGALRLYESQHTGNDLADCADCLAVTQVSGSLGSGSNTGNGTAHTLTVSPQAGPVHIKLADPYQGNQPIGGVVRSDGTVLNAANVWLSKTLDQDDKISYDHYLNLFDTSAAGSYTVTFGGQAQVNQAPVMQYIANYTTYETGQVGFLVQASDPDSTVPVLGAAGLPSGATFTDKGNGQGVLSWYPQVGQAGSYDVSFTASDGELLAQRSTNIRVYPNSDRDGDGMDDAWEMDHFGTLDRDGTGDFDGDGILDIDEYNRDSDPTVTEQAPTAPQLDTPADDAEVTVLAPTLRILNGDNSALGNVSYTFEIYDNESLTQQVAVIADVPEGVDTTEVTLDSTTLGGATLQDNHRYYWRVNARTGAGASEWVNGRFFVNTQNDAPNAFTLSKPVDQVLVDTESPELEINNSADLDGDAITYAFEVYHESDMTFSNPVASVSGLAQGGQGQTRWTVSTALLNGQLYYWIATATDEHGATTVGEPASFIVSTSNLAPAAPDLASPAQDAVIDSTSTTLTVNNAQDPERGTVTYFFELDTVNTFDSPALQQSLAVDEGIDTTGWFVDALVKGQDYYWRAKASDGSAESGWTVGHFKVKSDNQAPPMPTLNNPADTAWVEVLTPTLSAHPVTDPDGDTVSYEFELYSDDAMTALMASVVSATTDWTLTAELTNHTSSYWRARTVDSQGAASAWTALQSFFTNKDGIDDAPTLSFVEPSTLVETFGGTVTLQWVDQDPDSNATISLYANGSTLIASGLAEDDDGDGDRFDWNLGALPAGDYTISAVIDDGTSQVTANACCVVRKLASTVAATVTAVGEAATNEIGTQVAEFDVTLDSPPTQGSTVLINLSVSDASEGQILDDLAYLEFTPDNWADPQRVRLSGVDDCDADGDTTYYLQFAAATSSDDRFNGMATPDAAIVNRDNEVAGEPLHLCGFEQLTKTDLGGGTSEYELRAQVRNMALGVSSATATAADFGSLTLVSGHPVQFPAIEGGATVWSDSHLIVQAPTSETPNLMALAWSLSGTAPTITTEAATEAVAGEGYSYQLQADGDNLTYSLVEAPEGVTLDPQTGLLTWTPTDGQQGAQRIVIEVRDAQGGVARQTLDLNVAPSGQGNARVIIVDTNPAAGAEFQSLSAAVNSLSNPFAGDFTQPVIIRARATSGMPDTQPVLIANTKPTAENDFTIILEDGYLLDVVAVDTNSYAIHISDNFVSVLGEGGGIRITNNGFSGVDGIQISDQYNNSVVHLERLRIDAVITGEPTSGSGLDLSGGSTVTYVVRNNVITGFTGLDDNAAIATAAEVYVYNNTLVGNRYGIRWGTYSAGLVVNNLAVDNETGYAAWGATIWGVNNAHNVTDGAFAADPEFANRDVGFIDKSAGNYQLAPWDEGARSQGLDLSNGAYYPFSTDAQGKTRSVPWDVGAHTVGEVSNWPPMFQTEAPLQVEETLGYQYTALATDHDGDTVTYRLERAPAGMTIDSSSGLVNWTPRSDQLGSNTVVIIAQDGKGGLAEQTFIVEVIPAAENGTRLVVVDTNPDADADYISINAANAGERTTLTQPLVIRARATSGLPDTSAVEFGMMEPSADAPLTIILEEGYTMEINASTDYAFGFFLRSPYIRIRGEGGRIVIHNNGYNYATAIKVDNQSAGSEMIFENLLIEAEITGNPSNSTGISAGDWNAVYVLRNNVISGFTGTSASSGMFVDGTAYVYNNTLVDNNYGLRVATNNARVYNNLSVGNAWKDYSLFSASWGATGNNVSSDGSSPDSAFRSRSVTFQSSYDDLRLARTDTGARGLGQDLSTVTDYPFTYYQTGETRQGPWDIGAMPVAD